MEPARTHITHGSSRCDGAQAAHEASKGHVPSQGAGRPDAGTKNGPTGLDSDKRRSGQPAGTLPQKRPMPGNADFAERFGMEGEPDLHKYDRLTNFVKEIKQAMNQKGFDKNKYSARPAPAALVRRRLAWLGE